MRTLLAILFLAVMAVTSASALRVEHYSNTCPPGSALTLFRVYVVYSDEGCPISAAGVDCDGRSWTVTFGMQSTPEPGQTVPVTWVKSLSTSTLDVTSTDEVDFKVINLKNGQYVGGDYHIDGNGGVVSIDISSWESGFYGIVSFRGEYTISMTTFSN